MSARRWRKTLAPLLMLWPSAAAADEWALPSLRTYVAPHGHVRLVVVPRDLRSQLGYFDDKVHRHEPAWQRSGAATERHAHARLEEQDAAGAWHVVWDRPLVNDVGPVTALVATFDNWHSLGFGRNAVVVYGAGGRIVRSLSLDAILPADYIEALPRSVSSLSWGGDHRLSPDGRVLVLQVLVPVMESQTGGGSYVERRIDMATGVVLPPGLDWDGALAAAHRVAAARRAAATEQDRFFRAALVAPTSGRDQDWHRYLEEAFFRVDPDWKDGYPDKQVLRLPSAADYAPSEKWLRDVITGADDLGSTLMIASSSQDHLLIVLTSSVRSAKAGRLHGRRVYVVADPAHRVAVVAALAPTGAHVIVLDPRQPIPQRPERLRSRSSGRSAMDD